MTGEPRRILHVVDRASGGVPVAVAAYIQNSPDGLEHHVLTPFDSENRPPAAFHNVNAEMIPLREGHIRRLHQIASTSKRLRPMMVHAHSSFAGGYTRLAMRDGRRRIVYTPHCYAFQRTDVSRAARWAYRAIEWVLGWNTATLAACSPREAAMSEEMASLRGRARMLPNVASVPAARGVVWDGVAPLRVAMVGRLSPQKDPGYFEAVVAELRRHAEIEAIWFGDGDDAYISRLENADIDVTGWVSPSTVSRGLAEAHLYIHTAAWEGFPISLLDAHCLDRPMLVRAIDSFSGVDPSATVEKGLPDLIDALSSADCFASWVKRNRVAWTTYLAGNTAAAQREELASIWGIESPRTENGLE